MHPIVRLVLGVILGFVGGSLLMMGIHTLTQPLYPPPEGVDIYDPAQRDAVTAWMETLPAGAYVLAAIVHWIGAATGAAIAMFVAGRHAIRPALIVGGLFTVAGLINVLTVPNPAWFPFVDLPGYLLVAWLVGKFLLRAPAPASDGS